MLPELWSCGYDPETLAHDARADAEPRDGPRSAQLGEAARRRDMWLAAGSVPELGEDGRIYDTALVFNPRGELVAWHRKAHLYPPTLEPSVFTPGDRSDDVRRPRRWAGWGWWSASTATSPRWPGRWRCAGPASSWPLRPTRWRGQRLGPPLPRHRPDQQPVVGAGEPGRLALHVDPARAPAGLWPRPAPWWRRRAGPCRARPRRAELLVHRIDLHIAYEREGISGLLEDERQPELYAELGEGLPTAS